MTARLPDPGGDANSWGNILNSFLVVAHNSDGTLQTSAISSGGGITSSQVGTANGVAGLNGSGLVPITQLGTGTGSSSTYLRGDGTWSAVAGSGVTTFNTRSGAVMPQSGDYTFAQVGAAQGLTPTAAKTSAYNANPGDFVPVDASGGSVTITLPTAPTDKSRVEVKLITTSGSNVAIVATGGSDVFNKSGGDSSVSLSLLNQAVMLQYAAGSPGIWYVQTDDLPLSQLDGRYSLSAISSQFKPETYGAKGDGKIVTDGAMTSGSAVLACTTSTPFASTDVGKYVLVWSAKTSSSYLFTQISGFTDSGHVTLNTTATNTVSGVGVLFGTDDTVAIQSAVNAAIARSQNGNGESAIVQFQDKIYCVASAPTVGANQGNAQINLTAISPTVGIKVQISLVGTGSNAQLLHWTGPQPPQQGTILMGMWTVGTLNTTYGNSAVIGGPVSGYGGGGGLFSTMFVVVDNLTVMVPMSTGAYSGMNLYGVGQASVPNFSYLPLAVTPVSTTWPAMATYGNSTYYPGGSCGLIMPAIGNNAVADIGNYVCYFAQVALIASEHANWKSMKTIFCAFGVLSMGNSGGNSCHGITGLYWTCEVVDYPIGSVSSGYYVLSHAIGITVHHLSLESYHNIVGDASGNLQGIVHFDDLSAVNRYYGSSLYTNANLGVKIVQVNTGAGPVASPQAAPATTVAWNNYYYHDAWITVSLSGGTFTSLAIDSTAQPNAAGVSSYSFYLTSGHAYTPTYSAGTLSHTVTLL